MGSWSFANPKFTRAGAVGPPLCKQIPCQSTNCGHVGVPDTGGSLQHGDITEDHGHITHSFSKSVVFATPFPAIAAKADFDPAAPADPPRAPMHPTIEANPRLHPL